MQSNFWITLKVKCDVYLKDAKTKLSNNSTGRHGHVFCMHGHIYIIHITYTQSKQFCIFQNVHTFPVLEPEKNSVVSNSLLFKIKTPPWSPTRNLEFWASATALNRCIIVFSFYTFTDKKSRNKNVAKWETKRAKTTHNNSLFQ